MGPGATKQQKEVIAAVSDNPALTDVFANMLKEVGNDPAALAQSSRGNLEAALTALPAGPALATEFKQLVELTNGTLEARLGTHSAYEFRLTLKDVQPGQTQETLEALVAEMNEQFPAMKNYPSCGFKVDLSQNGDLPRYNEAGNVVFTCSSLIRDSTNRHRKDTITLNCEERISQEALLSAHGLVQVPNDVVRVVAGMYRVAQGAQGFPDTQGDIGTERDKGDVFEGKVARTKRGSSSGSAASSLNGVDDSYWDDVDFAFANVGIVGGLSPELK
jgi:hypothetical protein